MRSNKRKESRHPCVSCSSVELTRALHCAPCGHFYCASCLKRMARLSTQDRALVPLRCCRKELTVECVAYAFSMTKDGDFEQYQRYVEERTQKWESSDLVSDAEYAQAVRLVGAKHCPGCGLGVQRGEGCIHITCPNGHQFCFTCLAVWRTCHCQLIPEHEIRQILGE